MVDVIAENFFLDSLQGRADRMGLGQHVDAIAIVLDHSENTADLALDAPQTNRDRFFRYLGFVLH